MKPAFAPAGIISITTDFGHKGPFIGVMKGRILQDFAGAQLVDLTHDTLAHWPAEAGFWISRAYQYFPAGSVHIAVVDPGVGTDRDVIAIILDGHVFIAPDNGLLGILAPDPASAHIYRLGSKTSESLGIRTPSATFHGRDVFAPLAAAIASGRCAPWDIGPQVHDIVPGWLEEPAVSDQGVAGMVVTVDNFGNLITNIDAALIQHFKTPVARVGGRTIAFCRTYANVQPGEYLALINSFGVVEVACGERSAADGLGTGRGAPVIINNLNQNTSD